MRSTVLALRTTWLSWGSFILITLLMAPEATNPAAMFTNLLWLGFVFSLTHIAYVSRDAYAKSLMESDKYKDTVEGLLEYITQADVITILQRMSIDTLKAFAEEDAAKMLTDDENVVPEDLLALRKTTEEKSKEMKDRFWSTHSFFASKNYVMREKISDYDSA